jgi:hypothetical protein
MEGVLQNNQTKLVPSDISMPIHIANKILPTSCGCWLWVGELSGSGYGRGWYNGVRIAAHRIVYALHTGDWNEGKVLDHECCNPACCNPEHVKPMSQLNNIRLRDKRIRQRKRKSKCQSS